MPEDKTCADPLKKYREFAAEIQRVARAGMLSYGQVVEMLERAHQSFEDRVDKEDGSNA